MCATLYYPIQAVYARGLHESVLGNVKVNKNNAGDALLYRVYRVFLKNGIFYLLHCTHLY